MSKERPETPKGKSKRKKLILSKETLKDLTAKDCGIKGGRAAHRPPMVSCQYCSF